MPVEGSDALIQEYTAAHVRAPPNLRRLEEFEGSLASYHLQSTAMKLETTAELGCILKLTTMRGDVKSSCLIAATVQQSHCHNFCRRFDRDFKVAPYEEWNR